MAFTRLINLNCHKLVVSVQNVCQMQHLSPHLSPWIFFQQSFFIVTGLTVLCLCLWVWIMPLWHGQDITRSVHFLLRNILKCQSCNPRQQGGNNHQQTQKTPANIQKSTHRHRKHQQSDINWRHHKFMLTLIKRVSVLQGEEQKERCDAFRAAWRSFDF